MVIEGIAIIIFPYSMGLGYKKMLEKITTAKDKQTKGQYIIFFYIYGRTILF